LSSGDLSDEEAVHEMVRGVMEGFGRVDAFVDNAGISAIAPPRRGPWPTGTAPSP
jgi:NAD(P)-dependent dehydrogenase (short-subunit alcohol dehydrogenase family)